MWGFLEDLGGVLMQGYAGDGLRLATKWIKGQGHFCHLKESRVTRVGLNLTSTSLRLLLDHELFAMPLEQAKMGDASERLLESLAVDLLLKCR
jgi:hypothetical protein